MAQTANYQRIKELIEILTKLEGNDIGRQEKNHLAEDRAMIKYINYN